MILLRIMIVVAVVVVDAAICGTSYEHAPRRMEGWGGGVGRFEV